MKENLSPKLKEYKTEYDFLTKKIAELRWELATIYNGKRCVFRNEIEPLHEEIDNYEANLAILLEKVDAEIQRTKPPMKKIVKK